MTPPVQMLVKSALNIRKTEVSCSLAVHFITLIGNLKPNRWHNLSCDDTTCNKVETFKKISGLHSKHFLSYPQISIVFVKVRKWPLQVIRWKSKYFLECFCVNLSFVVSEPIIVLLIRVFLLVTNLIYACTCIFIFLYYLIYYCFFLL